MYEIVIQNVYKNYGKKEALKNINLKIEEGMFGLLGRNGAGKTTFMRILATLHRETKGNIEICGINIKEGEKIREIIGYLPQDFYVYLNMTVYEVMDYLAVLSEVKKEERKDKIKFLLQKVNLQNNYRTKFKSLSGGMKRRLGIAQALLNDPKVLIVDEPTAGLDPEERIRFRNLLCELASEKIVILSTHIVEDIEKTCKNIAVLNEGEIIYSGLLEDFVGDYENLEVAYMKLMGGV